MESLIAYLNWWTQSWIHVVFGLGIHGAIAILFEETVANICRVGIAFATRPRNGGSDE